MRWLPLSAVYNSYALEFASTSYRKMVKKYHPDKLQDLGEEHLQGAKEKFQSIQDAYEKIKNERGL